MGSSKVTIQTGQAEEDKETIKRVFIVPALEFTAKVPLPEQENYSIPRTKLAIRKLVKENYLQPMHASVYKKAYLPTNYPRWYKSKYAYEIPYTLYFEPYYIARLGKEYPPRYDERFVNFGINKAQQAFELKAAGYSFTVLPDVFVIDIAQPKEWKADFKPGKVHELFEDFRKEMKEKYGYEYDDSDILTYINSVQE